MEKIKDYGTLNRKENQCRTKTLKEKTNNTKFLSSPTANNDCRSL